MEHLNVEVEEQTDVPPIPINIETDEVGVEQFNVEAEEQTNIPASSTSLENEKCSQTSCLVARLQDYVNPKYDKL